MSSGWPQMPPGDPKDWPQLPTEKWARWNWKDGGFGRWHAIASWGMGTTADGKTVPAVSTACGKTRTIPSALAQRPGEPVCDNCLNLEHIRAKFDGIGADDAPSEREKVPVPVVPYSNPEPGSVEWQDEPLPG